MIDTPALPPGRVHAPLRGLAQQHLRHPRAHRHPRCRPGDRGLTRRCARCCPSCWRCRPARRGTKTATPTCTRPAPRSSPACSRAAGSPTTWRTGQEYADFVRFLVVDGLDPRAHRDLVERAAAPGVPDRRDADLRRPARVRRGGGARRADGGAAPPDFARMLRRGPARYPTYAPAAARGEPVAGDPLGHVRRADRPGRRPGRCRPGRGSTPCSTSVAEMAGRARHHRRTWRRSRAPTLPSSCSCRAGRRGRRRASCGRRVVERTHASAGEWLAELAAKDAG